MAEERKAIDILIDYMRLKAQLLPKYRNRYFTKKDEADMRKWSETTARIVLRRMRRDLKLIGHFDTASCVFCQANDTCTGCTYGLRHGICSQPASTYIMIRRAIRLDNLCDSLDDSGRARLQEVLQEKCMWYKKKVQNT